MRSRSPRLGPEVSSGGLDKQTERASGAANGVTLAGVSTPGGGPDPLSAPLTSRYDFGPGTISGARIWAAKTVVVLPSHAYLVRLVTFRAVLEPGSASRLHAVAGPLGNTAHCVRVRPRSTMPMCDVSGHRKMQSSGLIGHHARTGPPRDRRNTVKKDKRRIPEATAGPRRSRQCSSSCGKGLPPFPS